MRVWPKVYLNVKHRLDPRETEVAVEWRGRNNGSRCIGVLTKAALEELHVQTSNALQSINRCKVRRKGRV